MGWILWAVADGAIGSSQPKVVLKLGLGGGSGTNLVAAARCGVARHATKPWCRFLERWWIGGGTYEDFSVFDLLSPRPNDNTPQICTCTCKKLSVLGQGEDRRRLVTSPRGSGAWRRRRRRSRWPGGAS